MDSKWIWWKHGVIYQIYPRSFYDSNGDGIGDIPGIIEKLDYLKDLGIDAIWLSPVNTSPMHDFGYDISNYRDIDEIFGSKKDFRELIKEAHLRDIKIIMDMVVNHTSHMHQWFIESRSSLDNPKRDWYIWRDGKNGKPPNNWIAAFGGSSWEKYAHTGQYYLHSFVKEQPDVNWRNKELREAMYNEMRYWLDRGVDGFRLDVVNWFMKDENFRNNTLSLRPQQLQKHRYDRNRPESHEIMKEIRQVVDSYKDRMLVGEVFSLPPGDPKLSASYIGDGTDELHMAFDFSMIYKRWNARTVYRTIARWMEIIPENGWPCHVLSNHDQPRSISRFGGGSDAIKRARVAATLLLTLKGTPFIYYGEEIGMRNISISRKDIQDPLGKRYWPLYTGRDPARAPMQWSSEENAGFTRGTVWLPVHRNYRRVNVETDAADKYSMLNHYKSLIRIRKKKKALHMGDWTPLIKGVDSIIAYTRECEEQKIFVVLNFSNGVRKLTLNDRGQWRVISSTHKFVNEHFTDIDFKVMPYEATIVQRIGAL